MWTRRFWLTLWAFTPPLLLALGVVNAAQGDRPGRPEIGLLAYTFPAEYLDTKLTRYLYYHGLFGLGSRIAASDIVLIGSSHIELGISATRLSSAAGRDVFNLGLSGGTVSFGLDILKKNGAVPGLVVADVYSDYALKAGEREAESNDVYQAYAAVLRAWGELAFDWLLDPLLPRFYVRGSRLSLDRYLATAIVMNDSLHGGTVSLWFPSVGEVYAGGPTSWYLQQRGAYIDIAKKSIEAGFDWNLTARNFQLSREVMIKARSLGSKLVATMVPYVKVAEKVVAHEDAGPEASVPFLPISADGLHSYDGAHLILPAAVIATDRLLARLRERGLSVSPFGGRISN